MPRNYYVELTVSRGTTCTEKPNVKFTNFLLSAEYGDKIEIVGEDVYHLYKRVKESLAGNGFEILEEVYSEETYKDYSIEIVR